MNERVNRPTFGMMPTERVAYSPISERKKLDCRVKPGNDEREVTCT